jgi:hypothetical protein
MSQCFYEGCKETPVATYVWPWGETGLTCAQHQIVLRQKASQLNRDVVITPMQPGAPTPMTRDERITSQARILTLEAELEEARTRGVEMYRSNEQLTAQLRVEQAKTAELDAALTAATNRYDELVAMTGELRAELAEAVDELGKLRAVVTAGPLE